MTGYLIQPRHWKFVKAYGSLFFARNVGENKSKILSSKYSQKRIDHAIQSATDALKTASKIAIQKIAEATDLTGNKIADKIIPASKISPHNIQKQIKN